MFQLKSASELIVEIYVQSGAKVSQIVGCHGERLKIKISSPPVDGKANQEVLAFFAKFFSLTKANVELVAGEKSRNKRVLIRGDGQYFIDKLKELIK